MPGNDDARALWKPQEVAEATGCSRTKIYALIASGEIPSVRLGRASVRVPGWWLKQFFERDGDISGAAPSFGQSYPSLTSEKQGVRNVR